MAQSRWEERGQESKRGSLFLPSSCSQGPSLGAGRCPSLDTLLASTHSMRIAGYGILVVPVMRWKHPRSAEFLLRELGAPGGEAVYFSKQTDVKTIISSGFNKNRPPAKLAGRPQLAEPWLSRNCDKPLGWGQASVQQKSPRERSYRQNLHLGPVAETHAQNMLSKLLHAGPGVRSAWVLTEGARYKGKRLRLQGASSQDPRPPVMNFTAHIKVVKVVKAGGLCLLPQRSSLS